MSDIFDWTISEAPAPDEVPAEELLFPPGPDPSPEKESHPAAHELTHARRFSRWMWLRVGGTIAVAALALGLYFASNRQHIRNDVTQTVAREEQAALDHDTRAVAELTAEGYPNWLAQQTERVKLGFASPLPSGALHPVAKAGVVQSLTNFTSNIVRADVARQFTTPEGAVITFTLPQFYQFGSNWKRIAPPDNYGAERRQYTGQRVEISYYTLDSDLVLELGPYLDDALARACADWECPADLGVTIYFLNEVEPLEATLAPPGQGPVLFALIESSPKWLDNVPLILPAPHRAGTPTDAAGVEWLKRTIALQTLTKATQQLSLNSFEIQVGNAFLHALVAREAMRLGLEPLEALEVEEVNFAPSANALWALNETEAWDWPADRATALRAGLTILNRLLQNQPTGTDMALLRALKTNYDPWDWLTTSLGLTRDEIQARLWEAGSSQVNVRIIAAPPLKLALSCNSGLALLSLEEGERWLRRLVTAPFLDARPISWSPDGERLLMELSGQLAVATPGRPQWLPPVAHPDHVQPVAWVSAEVLAYLAYTARPDGSTEWKGLKFFDIANPQRKLPFVSGIRDYVLSPDRARAVVIGAALEHEDELGVMPRFGPVPGKEITWLGDTGFSPAWSPDGRSLAYVHLEEDGKSYSVRVAVLPDESEVYMVQPGDTLWDISLRFNASVVALMDVNRLTSATILAGQTLVIPRLEATGSAPVSIVSNLASSQALDQRADPELMHLVWSPALDQLALVAPRKDETGLRVLLISPDGLYLRLLLDRELSYVTRPQFSADGKFLAISTRVDVETVGTALIYDTTTRALARTLPEALDYAWSPTGHEMVFLGPDGAYSIGNPGLESETPLKLVDGHCDEVMWRP